MNINQVPENLPIPVDDGATDHLLSSKLPRAELPATDGNTVNLGDLEGLMVLYVYPMTGRPDTPLPDGWDEIPGARGCTPQSCSFRDHHAELQEYNAGVYGISTQTTDYQTEARDRLHLPFEMLSDSSLLLKGLLNLPTFHVDDMELYKRLTMIIQDGVIVKVFYPVFPPDKSADQVLEWLKVHGIRVT